MFAATCGDCAKQAIRKNGARRALPIQGVDK